MSSQIFSSAPPKDTLIDFIKAHATPYNKYYIFSDIKFKQAKWNEKIDEFINAMKGNYFKSKMEKYVNKALTYKSFANILRQICRFHGIIFFSKIKYIKSKHITEYFIVIPSD